ncbi:MAG: MFS transporter [Elusimicrobia bacterium]|nr:MFS transporter [Elusimicrobiota bacterium]
MAEENKGSESFIAKFMVLKGAARELWIIFGAKLLAILAYGVMNSTLVLWLSSDLGFDDSVAGAWVGAWSLLMTLFTVLTGSLVDAIGLRKSFLLGFFVCILSRGVMTFSPDKWVALFCGLLPLALGEALMTPVMVAAVRRYSTTAQRSISFSIFYCMMNVGFFIGSLIFDYLRKGLGEHGTLVLPILGMTISTYRTLFLTSFLLTIPNLLIMYFGLRDGVEATDEGLKISPDKPKYPGEGAVKAFFLMVRDAFNETITIFANLWKQPAFYRFLAFLALIVGIRLVLYHLYYTYPKFGIRELGDGAPIGRLCWSLNSLVVIILVPFIGALTQRFSAYRMVLFGSTLAAASVFLMATPPSWWQPLADGFLGDLVAHKWLGVQGSVNPYYVMIFVFVVVYSVGEVFWTPRLYEYTSAIAPKGQEASYMSLSYLPFLLAKLGAGPLSGWLLTNYCPAQGPRNSGTMWLIIGIMALITPAGLLVFRRFVKVQEAGRAD